MYKKVESFIICCMDTRHRTRHFSMAIAKFLFNNPNKRRGGGISTITEKYLRISKNGKLYYVFAQKIYIILFSG